MSRLDRRLAPALVEAGVPFRENEPFSRHTTMGVGGPATLMAFPRTIDELALCLALRSQFDAPHRVLGAGSNLIVVDQGLDELILNTEALTRVEVGGGRAVVQAGANLIRTALAACRAGWRGLERAVGIPGSLGGAAIMNAGAYGFSLSDILEEIVVLDGSGARLVPPGGWTFAYRGSSIPDGAAVACLTVRLTEDDPRAFEKEDPGDRRPATSLPAGRAKRGMRLQEPAGCGGRSPHRRARLEGDPRRGRRGLGSPRQLPGERRRWHRGRRSRAPRSDPRRGPA